MKKIREIRCYGFTLVELLVVIAVIAILAGAIMVSISGQKETAIQAKTLSELSATIQPMLMCWSDEGTVSSPSGSGGGSICIAGGVEDSDYGTWPDLSTGLSYEVTSPFENGDWAFWVTSPESQVIICCSSAKSKCEELKVGEACSP